MSSEEISALINMEVSFDDYRFFGGNNLELSGLRIRTPYPKEEYKTVNTYHVDWINAAFPKVRIYNFDYIQLIRNRQFHASSIEIMNADIEVYRDKTLGEPPFKYQPLLASLMRELNADLKVDTLFIRSSRVHYNENTKFSEDPGILNFENLYASGYNLTNNPEMLAINSIFSLDVQAHLLGKAMINTQLLLDLASESDFFRMTAKVAPFQADILNQMIGGILPVKIKEGEFKGIDLNFIADENRSSGWVDFEYENMKFEFIDPEAGRFRNLVKNTALGLTIRSNNLKDSRNYRQGQVEFERRKDRFVFNYWWNSLKSGLLNTMMTDAAKFLELDEKAMEEAQEKD
ncbi:MAG: hypothetical protein EA362_14090 [Saprospirales bacterium]|nr:MAG: hypothetical protein EA362_14090 [Saprospirales bacterium]